MGAQLEIMPLEVVDYLGFEGKIGRGRGVAENGVAYVVKSDNGDRPICATEWICTAIAEALGLPVAQTKVLKMQGKLVFGSELMSNKLTDVELGALLLEGIKANGLHTPNLRAAISQIFTLDVLLGNHDRHPANYLMTTEWSDDRTSRFGHLRPFDFESSNLLTRDTVKLPLAESSHTVQWGRKVQGVHAFDTPPALHLLTQFAKGREFIVERATTGLPTEWLSASDRSSLIERVRSNSFERDIHAVRQGIESGSIF